MIPLRDKLRNPDCTLCPLHQDAQYVCLFGAGPYPAEMLLVGDTPGFRQDRDIHKPLQGKAGKLLDSILYAFDLDRSEVYISHAVKCRPIEGDKDSKPSKGAIRTCSTEYLTKEVEAVKPKVIIAMGKIAVNALIEEGLSVDKARNKIWKTKEPYPVGIPIIATYHPNAATYDDGLTARITEDFEWVFRFLKHGEEKENVVYERVDSIDSIPGIHNARWISVDLETDGFDCFIEGRSIISIQLSCQSGTGYYLRWDDRVREEVKPLLQDENIGKIGHNLGKFDKKWLRSQGIELRGPLRDTLLEIQLLDENLLDKSLDVIVSNYTPLKKHKDEMQDYIRKNKCTFREVPLEIAVPYGCADVDGSLRVAKKFTKPLKSEGLVPLYKMMLGAQALINEAEWDGIKVDVDLFDELEDHYEKSIKIHQKEFNRLAGRECNPRSHVQVKSILYDKWKLPAMGDPEKWNGPPTKNTAEVTINRLRDWMESEDGDFTRQLAFINKLIELRSEKVLLSTFIQGMGDYVREGDLIHPNFRLHGTVTGRWSCRDPNLQQIPREGEIKRLFVSRFGRHGYIMQVDVSQGELRWGAHRSGERNLLSAFRGGSADIHRTVAAEVLGIPEEEVTKEQRKQAKTVNFGVMYGAGAGKMATQMGCSISEAQDFINRWHYKYSDWQPYERLITKRVLRDGYVTNDFGRRRRLPILDPKSKQGKESIRQAINAPIQGDLADFTIWNGVFVKSLFKMLQLKRTHFVAQIHDAWLLDVHESEVEAVTRLFIDAFTQPEQRLKKEFGFTLFCPMDIEVSIGPNWKEQTTLYPVQEAV